MEAVEGGGKGSWEGKGWQDGVGGDGEQMWPYGRAIRATERRRSGFAQNVEQCRGVPS